MILPEPLIESAQREEPSALINAVPVSQRVSYLPSNDRRSHISTGDTAINYQDGERRAASGAEDESGERRSEGFGPSEA